MPDDIFGGATKQHVLKAKSISRRNDEVSCMFSCPHTNTSGVPDLQ